MSTLKFKNLCFEEENDQIKVVFYRYFYFYLNKADLKAISSFKVKQNQIRFGCPLQRAERRFNQVLALNIKNLKNIVTQNPAIYVHKNSNIPLIGNLAFGLIYRNTSIIEIKPQTGCNLNCIFCSVSEGLDSKQTDFIVEKDYLIEEFKKLLAFVKEEVEVHIGCHGEPLLYADLVPLIKDLLAFKKVKLVSLDTNGVLLTKGLIDQLARFKKIRLNISLNALSPEIAQKMAGTAYNLKHVLKMIKYAAQKIGVLIAPILLPGYNEEEMIKLIRFTQTLLMRNRIKIGIQNFLNYKTGRNPVKAWDWETFKTKLKKLEEKTKTKLILDFKKDFQIKETIKLAKPFYKGDKVKAIVVCPGRFPHSVIAVAQNRNITVLNCSKRAGKKIKIKIIRDKHNIFLAKLI